MANKYATAIITAGGAGKRFAGEGDHKLPKQFTPLSGKPVIVYSLECFQRSELIEDIVAVVPGAWVEYTKGEIVKKYHLTKVSNIIAGGDERQQSVEMGIQSIAQKPEIVVVHDGVRPFVTSDLVEEVISQAKMSGGAIAAIPSTDTVKKSGTDNYIDSTMPREEIWLAQTPQAFKYEIILEAFEKASEDGYLGTDEAELVERLGKEVVLVKSSKHNIKITTPEDIVLGEQILKFRNT